jgi:hypothetical protein
VSGQWTAYCAPGQRAWAAIVLALEGRRVTEIREHPRLTGSRDTWLVLATAQDAPGEDELVALIRRASGSGRAGS